MKWVFIVFWGLAAVVGLGIFSASKRTDDTIVDRIDKECRRTYGSEGEARVIDCKNEMAIRVLNERERAKSKDTYDRIK